MSRFYKIVVGPETAQPVGGGAPSNNSGAIWTNFVGGTADLGAQTIELDIVSTSIDQPVSAGSVKIWGPSRKQLSQASDFNGAQIQVFAGMQKGLPLATTDFNSGQQGLIAQGVIFQAFGNWQGVNQTLDFVILPSADNNQITPSNISYKWEKGTPLSEAIQRVLSIAYPKFDAPVINISPDLVVTQDETFVYQTPKQFGTYVRGISKNIIGNGIPNYQGVSIVQDGNHFNVFDGTAQQQTATSASAQTTADAQTSTTKTIRFADLIGQVTWLGPNAVQFNTVMRADINLGNFVTFPSEAQLYAITNADSASFARDRNAFKGKWQITFVRHVGNSRAPDAQSWITNFQAVQLSAGQ